MRLYVYGPKVDGKHMCLGGQCVFELWTFLCVSRCVGFTLILKVAHSVVDEDGGAICYVWTAFIFTI